MKNATLAIPLVLAMLVSACGGGGGESAPPTTDGGGSTGHTPASVSAPAPAAAPDPAPAAAPAPAPAPTGILQSGAFVPFGPTVLATNIDIAGHHGLISAARLTGGGSVVAWSTGTSVLAQRLGVDGTPIGEAQTVGPVLADDLDVSTRVSVVASADGGWLVAWIAPDRTVLFRPYDASGAPAAAAAPVDTAVYAKVVGVQARALADGGFVLAWVAAEGTGPTRAFLRRFNAGGAAITDRVGPGGSAGTQSFVQVTPLPDGNFLAAWVQGNPDGTDTLLARRLDAGLNAAGAEQVLQPAAQLHPYRLLGASTLSGGAALFAWGYDDGGTVQARWQLLDASGAPLLPLGAPGSSDNMRGRIMDSVEVIPAGTGFRVVTESTFTNFRLGTAFTTVLDVGSAGERLASTETSRDLFTVSEISANGCRGPVGRGPGVAAAGGEDGHYLLASMACPRPSLDAVVRANLEVSGH